ncbi:hypothetical protein GCM10010168_47000 [Actinoplanes ianthinogenes]|uniref:Uncharacterized protein n=1 Tax=Actinoplanes ianthinogenes TaxID=122358 RepID=A0ABN6C8G7_9ACTN|nr:DUF6114 domain-containing protein [Actinoplanes ianthinogenes]BCJ41001.1 hypothetical protein Aiant_16580 [Actinoplanes ianthinogenes]GGR23609.1 hypothetical protein GCM10010168_47000 [Actinoplanes ianthinogenes]
MSGTGTHRVSPGARAWRGFRTWRRSRPFWGGLLVLLGGTEILMTVWAPLGVVLHVGMQNFIGYLLPFVIILLGVLLILNPAQHVFYALIAMVCGLGTFLTSNMGGFLIGLLLTLVGGALGFAWAPISAEPTAPPGAEAPDDAAASGPATEGPPAAFPPLPGSGQSAAPVTQKPAPQ